jgi:hypothetical protein
VDETEVGRLLRERQQHRGTKQFDKADKVKAQLLKLGVRIDDKLRIWRTPLLETVPIRPSFPSLASPRAAAALQLSA